MKNNKKPLPTVFIVDGVRTAISSPYRSFKTLTADQLAARVIKEIVRRNKVKKISVSQVIFGNVVSAGLGQNITRRAAVTAGLSVGSTSFTVNNTCGSGLLSVVLGMQSILLRENDIVISGGAESATHSPYLVKRADAENHRVKGMVDSLLYDGLTCQLTDKRMGDLSEQLAKKHRVSREEQDQYSLQSHRKACLAQSQGVFSNEIIAIPVTSKRIVKKDDRPRRNINLESFKDLKPVFKKKGCVTAGNTSVPCDGAAAVLLASQKAVGKYKLKPLGKILGYSSIGVDPKLTFEAEATAIKACLKKCRLLLKDIDLFEVSEAFAAQAIFIRRKIKIPEGKLNVFGGDLAFGHPLGAAGTRLLVTLLHGLKTKGLKKGLVCISYGGGGAMAIIIERC